MRSLKAAYINELYKISKRKKLAFAAALSAAAVILSAAAIRGIDVFTGIKLAGSSEFPILVLAVFSYTLTPLFTAFVCIDLFGGEFSDLTIKITLTGPASRFKVFCAKALAVLSFIASNLFFVLILSLAASVFLGGSSLSAARVAVAYAAEVLPLFIFALAVIVISNLVKSPAGAFLLSVLVFISFLGLGAFFPAFKSFLFTSALDWYRLFLGNYLNFSKMLRVFLILGGYGVMLFSIGYLLFDGRDV